MKFQTDLSRHGIIIFAFHCCHCIIEVLSKLYLHVVAVFFFIFLNKCNVNKFVLQIPYCDGVLLLAFQVLMHSNFLSSLNRVILYPKKKIVILTGKTHSSLCLNMLGTNWSLSVFRDSLSVPLCLNMLRNEIHFLD